MRVAGFQTDIVWEDQLANYAKLEEMIRDAAATSCGLIVLPEMFATGFSMDAEQVAEPPQAVSEMWLLDQSAINGVPILGSVATHDPEGGKPRNLALLVWPDGQVQRYAKIHPFTFAQEDRHYAPGTDVLVTDVGGCRVAVLICYDLRFGELFSALADRVDLFCVIANWPEPRRDHWRTLLKARSIEHMAYVLGVNRVGTGGGLVYTGDSALWAPGGELVCEAPAGEEVVIFGDVDPAVVAERRAKFPVLGDRRPDVYRKAGEH